MTTIANRLGSSAVLHFTSNSTIVVAGNTSVSNVAASNNEIVVGGSVITALWGTAESAAYWTIKRGANTVAVLSGTGSMDFSTFATPLNMDPTANVVVALNSALPGFLIIKIHKNSIQTNNEYLVG